MATEPTIPTIIQIAKISQYLAANDSAQSSALVGSYLDTRLPRMLYMERKAVELRYDLDPTDSTLTDTANYLWALCGKYQLQAQAILANQQELPPIVNGPSSVSITVGQNAVFTVSVSSTIPYTVQWFDSGGNPILGATNTTYTITNAQLTDSGKTFFAKATNAAGTTTSVVATLTVTQAIVGYFAYSPTTDFFAQISIGNDPFNYPTTFSITHNSHLVITLPPAMPANQYMIVKVPISESIKTMWQNTTLNFGTIPDTVFEAVQQFGGFSFYCSRGQISMDVTQTLTMT